MLIDRWLLRILGIGLLSELALDVYAMVRTAQAAITRYAVA